ncbi:uncharacterized bromodomain-containing protein 10 [Nerophis lumbriciformis]|uniref:uncharacterized bromodomain-containing protein 10 n=1 Tax=Nerophis lumbriciformis TaxID=546530 RepID=UPI002ADFCE6B|nr:uncharacterized protein KIAA2026-like [Nerophis lumbriciformis]XP_061783444.1 uncharacterized protein KIAA2026-like [Nerophis lumbriciformis]
MSSGSRWVRSPAEDMDLSNGTCEAETVVALHCPGDHPSTSNDGMSDFSNSDISLPEVCVSTDVEENTNYEVQQAYRIFCFLLDKQKGVAGPFLHQEARERGARGVRGLKQLMSLRIMEEKFTCREYKTITEFVTDFRLMLENCYRCHGVDHWMSKQAQKLEIMLEQKLTLLSRTLREKTTLAVTSGGRFGAGEERAPGGTSTRRRLSSRSLATVTVGGHESFMVQALRLEEQQKAKEERRQRELEKKEAEEMSSKAVEEWEHTLLSQASPHPVDTLWELPAIGHFLCLAQTALNLPEVVFFELERCLLMPRCSTLLSKIMSSLLSPWQRRPTLHRRPALPYRRWEAELRLRVKGWYRTVGAARIQTARAEQLGLCHQFFRNLGEVSPLEERPFHLLPFYQRVWLLKGLCDHVYETQKDVQDAVLAQPIHECRESILGYDSKDNAYIHFPHFCGADLRIYCQTPSMPPAFPFPSLLVRRVDMQAKNRGGLKNEEDGIFVDSGETLRCFKRENGDVGEHEERFWSMKEEKVCDAWSSDDDSIPVPSSLVGKRHFKEDTLDQSAVNKDGFSLGPVLGIKTESQDACLNVGEHSYTGRSPARSVDVKSPPPPFGTNAEVESPLRPTPFLDCRQTNESEQHGLQNLNKEDRTRSKKRKWKKKAQQNMSPCPAEANESALQEITATSPRKDKKRKHKEGKKLESAKKIKAEPSVEPSFKLVCTSLQELRELISKTEDELDELESTKKKLDRWYHRRQAVKELHSTLIRLRNELSPWEPKLVKAFQRNRLRLKKEFDDFKKHPDYSNFVREEFMSSSSDSSSDDDDDGTGVENEGCSLDDYRGSEEDLEYMVPRGLWTGGSARDVVAESVGKPSSTFEIFNHEKHLDSSQKLPRIATDSSSDVDSGLKSTYEMISLNQCRDSNAELAAQTSPTSKLQIFHPTIALPKGYTPIPTLLAKSVGNKVTLMKRPVDFSGAKKLNSKGCSNFLPVSLMGNAQVQIPQTTSQQTQEGGATSQTTMAPLKFDWDKPIVTLSQTSLQGVSNAPEGLCHLGMKDVGISLKMSVQPVLDRRTQDKVMQQVTLPFVHKSEEHQGTKATVCMSTNVPGFTIPARRVPAQQVAPLKDAQIVKTSSLSVPQNTTSFQGTTTSKTSLSMNQRSPMSPKPPDNKQELKTMCIRDCQSILVTTRGGNTGIVKVQTSSAQNPLGGLSTSPVITISPQFKAFLVSKASEASSVPSQRNPCTTSTTLTTVASLPVGQPKHSPSVYKSSTIPNPEVSTLTGGIPVAETRSWISGSPSNQGSILSGSQLVESTIDPLTQAKLISQPRLKWPGSEEQTQVTKCILVNPPLSSSARTVPKETSSSTNLNSRMVVVNQPAATASSSALVGSVPKQTTTLRGFNGQQLTTSLSSLQMGLSPGVISDVMSKGKNITLPTGLQVQLSGMTTTIGQNIGALSRNPSTITAMSNARPNTQMAPFSNSVTSSPSRLIPSATLTTISQACSLTSTVTTTPATASLVAGPARLSSNVQGNPKPPTTLTHQVPNVQMGKELTPNMSSFQNGLKKNPTIDSTQFSSPATNVQQRIVINTSKSLAAGTQIILNNTCFVVPPQGLGPGSHVLIISSPSSQKVPHASGNSIGPAVAPPQGASQPPSTHLTPILGGNPPFFVPGSIRTAQNPSTTFSSSLSPVLNTSPLVVPHPQFAKSPTHVPPALGPILAPIRLPSSTLSRAECSTAVTQALPGLPLPLSSLPSPSNNCVIQSTLHFQDVSSLKSSLQPPPTVSEASVIHKVFAGSTKAASRIQTLPVTATPTVTLPPSVGLVTTAQPLTVLDTFPQSNTCTSLLNPSLQKSPFSTANSAQPTKLLISPDGAILSHILPRQLHTCDTTTLQPSQADTKSTK